MSIVATYNNIQHQMDDKNAALMSAADAARAAAEATAGKAALGTTLAGSAAAAYGGYTLNEWAMIIGAIAAISGVLIQIVVQYHSYRMREQKAQREAEWHAARMEALSHGDVLHLERDVAGVFCDPAESGQ